MTKSGKSRGGNRSTKGGNQSGKGKGPAGLPSKNHGKASGDDRYNAPPKKRKK